MPRHMIDDAGIEPAAETATGETFNGNPVYRQTFDSAILGTAGGEVTVSTGVIDIVRVYGSADIDGTNWVALPYEDGVNQGRLVLTPGGNLIIVRNGGFTSRHYRVVVEYTK